MLVDAHVMTTPLIADVDGDGDDEIVAAVSYFFEEEAVASLARRGVVVDHTKYVAGGGRRALKTGEVKWSVHLDLTTDETKLRAIYSAHRRRPRRRRRDRGGGGHLDGVRVCARRPRRPLRRLPDPRCRTGAVVAAAADWRRPRAHRGGRDRFRGGVALVDDGGSA